MEAVKMANPRRRRRRRRNPSHVPAVVIPEKAGSGQMVVLSEALRPRPRRRPNPRVASIENPRRRRSSYRRRPRRYRRRRNPRPMDTIMGAARQAIPTVVGVYAGRALPRMILGARDTGIVGYAGNAAAAVALAGVARQINPRWSGPVAVGAMSALVIRALVDLVPLQTRARLGLGDLVGDYLIDARNVAGLGDVGLIPTMAEQGGQPIMLQDEASGLTVDTTTGAVYDAVGNHYGTMNAAELGDYLESAAFVRA